LLIICGFWRFLQVKKSIPAIIEVVVVKVFLFLFLIFSKVLGL
jgi:hypothetical protein